MARNLLQTYTILSNNNYDISSNLHNTFLSCCKKKILHPITSKKIGGLKLYVETFLKT